MKNMFLQRFLVSSENSVENQFHCSDVNKSYAKREATDILNKSKLNASKEDPLQKLKLKRNLSGNPTKARSKMNILKKSEIAAENNTSRHIDSIRKLNELSSANPTQVKKYQNERSQNINKVAIGSRKKYNEHINKLLAAKSLRQNPAENFTENKENLSEIEMNQSQQIQKKFLEQASFQFEITGKFPTKIDFFSQQHNVVDGEENMPYKGYEHLYLEEKKNDDLRNLINPLILKNLAHEKQKYQELVNHAYKGFISNKYKRLLSNLNNETK